MGRPQSCRYCASAGAAVVAVRCSRTKHVSCESGGRAEAQRAEYGAGCVRRVAGCAAGRGVCGAPWGVRRAVGCAAGRGECGARLAVGLAAPLLIHATWPDTRRAVARLHVGGAKIARDLLTELRRGRARRTLYEQQAVRQRPVVRLKPLPSVGSGGSRGPSDEKAGGREATGCQREARGRRRREEGRRERRGAEGGPAILRRVGARQGGRAGIPGPRTSSRLIFTLRESRLSRRISFHLAAAECSSYPGPAGASAGTRRSTFSRAASSCSAAVTNCDGAREVGAG